MAEERKPDFSGWASKNNLECSDGRTILAGAFKHQDNVTVPLVWQHDHDDPSNILGHAILENRAFGVYTHGYFNNTSRAQDSKEAVMHGDINKLSIYANKLKQRGGDVYHGNIVEVSLVMAGANPGASIETVSISHSEDPDKMESEAIIQTGLLLEHQDSDTEGVTPVADENDNQNNDSEETVQDVIDTMSEKQKNAMYYVIGEATKDKDKDDEKDDDGDDVEHGDAIKTEDFLTHIDQGIASSIKEGFNNMGNVFAENDKKAGASTGPSLSHSQFNDLVADAQKQKVDSMKDFLAHNAGDVLQHDGVAGEDYGITDLKFLFPDAKALETTPDFIARRREWVDAVLKGTKHSPFAKVKTLHADITEPEARAKGYITGTRKKEEVFKLLKRETGPTTVYKKQRLDRDDMLDIVDFDVVVWLQGEIRLMLEEEIARAILIGDGRTFDDEDKIKDPEGANQGVGIRSILHDDDLYAIKTVLPTNVSEDDMVKGIIRARTKFRGSGKPSLFISDTALTEMMLIEDKFGRAKYETEQALADKLRVKDIHTVELFDESPELVAIVVNLQDYTVGANKGGEITNFDDFDIDFNQYKYLSETRISGGLTKPFSAIVVTRAQGEVATPANPNFDQDLNLISIPTSTGVVYYINDEEVTGDVEITETTEVVARPDSGYYFAPGTTRQWTYTYSNNNG